jgi:hypothetical protein
MQGSGVREMPQEFEIEKKPRKARLMRLHFFTKLDNSCYFFQDSEIDKKSRGYMKYKVIFKISKFTLCGSIEKFIREINDEIAKGWIPQEINL